VHGGGGDGVLVAALAVSLLGPLQEPRPKEYWDAIQRAGYAVPEGESAYELLVELSQHLDSRDSQLRDDLAYTIATNWILRNRLLRPDELRGLARLWTQNLSVGVGEVNTDTVLLRSFSALDLALIASLDNEAPFLDADEFAALLDAALAYLAAERDLRGWVEGVGWVHATAHTADLLKFLARSRHLEPAGQKRILTAVAVRMTETQGHVFTFGEDERLAATVVAVLAREDHDPEAFDAFLTQLAEAPRALARAGRYDPALYAGAQNSKNLLRALHVFLAAAARSSPPLFDAGQAVLITLGRF
jgi:hypothetical protein